MGAGAPATHYAKSGDVHVAYQVVGDGPVDAVIVPGFVSHLDVLWDDPLWRSFFERIAAFSRLVLFDKRGTGLSDRLGGDTMPTLEERMDDVRAVMDAIGIERANLVGVSEGGPMALLFAATYPARVERLVMYGTTAKFVNGDGWDRGVDRAVLDQFTDVVAGAWGTGITAQAFAGGEDGERRELMARWERLGASPGGFRTIMAMLADIDVRAVLPSIHVPTLVLHRDGDTTPMAAAEYLAAEIPDARLVRLKGPHSVVIGDTDAVVREIEAFVTGATRARDVERVLSSVLFTDVVDSTARAAELGDTRWRAVLEHHDGIVRRVVERFHGRVVKTTGDGALATFDGPGRAVRAATAICDEVQRAGVSARAGVHTGEIELRGDDVAGLAVHLAQRVQSLAAPGETLVSRTVVDLVVGSGIVFEDRGEHALKGVPGEWRLFGVVAA